MNLPVLPPWPLEPQSMRGPTESSNWVIKDVVLCGEYPGNFEDKAHMATLMAYSQAGITTYVCLQQERELLKGRFRPYIEDYRGICSTLAGIPVTSSLLNFPIEDGFEAEDDNALFQFVLDLVTRIENGEKLFIHCWAGRGRTGIIVACLLGILYSIPAAEALKRTNTYYNHREVCFGDSPEYHPQKMQVYRVLQMHQTQKETTKAP
eukprot:Phypoly_transcript_08822.p1 GENE.Phypoly_transcript_08822~~Phypoly_transcript_08822.p1  ORF type:complete len:207 (-),score=21.86 Phypoly_transcript_08822:797-1417(-)